MVHPFFVKISEVEMESNSSQYYDNDRQFIPIWNHDPATFQALKDRLNTHGGGGSQGALTAAFRRMDANHSGTVRGEEIKRFLISTQRGMEDVNMKVIDAIVDLCDRDGDGEIDYSEMSRMILCDDIIELLSLVPDKTIKHAGQAYKNQVVGARGVTVAELQKAQQLIKERLNTKYKNVAAAL